MLTTSKHEAGPHGTASGKLVAYTVLAKKNPEVLRLTLRTAVTFDAGHIVEHRCAIYCSNARHEYF